MNEHGHSQFPITQAFLFAIQGIRLRLGRMLLVLAGVSVAIAFTNVLLTTNDLFDRLEVRQAALRQAQDSKAALRQAQDREAAKTKPAPAPLADESGQAGGRLLPVFRWLWMGVALLICTAGTLNAIVMSVTERIKEIGTLKCLGSRNIHIVEIFLFESVLLGVLGGILGGLLGYGGALLNFVATAGAKQFNGADALAVSSNILLCVAISTGLALLASVIPVLMAAKVEPAAAMRYEV